jgi:non-specific serine/threonine protein kinase
MRGDLERAAGWHHEALGLRRELGDWLSVAYSLETIAGTAAGAARLVEAARLLGAAERLREELAAPLPAGEMGRFEEALAPVRDGLDPTAFAAAWAAGRRLPREAAADEAVELAAALSSDLRRHDDPPSVGRWWPPGRSGPRHPLDR